MSDFESLSGLHRRVDPDELRRTIRRLKRQRTWAFMGGRWMDYDRLTRAINRVESGR